MPPNRLSCQESLEGMQKAQFITSSGFQPFSTLIRHTLANLCSRSFERVLHSTSCTAVVGLLHSAAKGFFSIHCARSTWYAFSQAVLFFSVLYSRYGCVISAFALASISGRNVQTINVITTHNRIQPDIRYRVIASPFFSKVLIMP